MKRRNKVEKITYKFDGVSGKLFKPEKGAKYLMVLSSRELMDKLDIQDAMTTFRKAFDAEISLSFIVNGDAGDVKFIEVPKSLFALKKRKHITLQEAFEHYNGYFVEPTDTIIEIIEGRDKKNEKY